MTIRHRKYSSYDKYIEHQGRKLDIALRKKIKKFMPEYFSKNVKSFKKRINIFKEYVKDGKTLCLGARNGEEVAAFIELGFKDAIGIDINPGKNNRYVIKGDFHKMDFMDESFDTIYSNCIDHVWDLRILSKEIARVLKKDSYLILEIDHLLNKDEKGRKELLKKSSKYESITYGGLEDVKKEFKEFKFVEKMISANSHFLAAVFKKI